MDDARRVHLLQTAGNLLEKASGRTVGELGERLALLRQEIREGAAVLHILCHDEVHTAVEAHVVEGQDGGVGDAPCDGRFALEASQLPLGEAELGEEYLDGDLALDGLVERAPDRAGAPPTDHLDEAVAAQKGARRGQCSEGLAVPSQAVDILEHLLQELACLGVEPPELHGWPELPCLLLQLQDRVEGRGGALGRHGLTAVSLPRCRLREGPAPRS